MEVEMLSFKTCYKIFNYDSHGNSKKTYRFMFCLIQDFLRSSGSEYSVSQSLLLLSYCLRSSFLLHAILNEGRYSCMQKYTLVPQVTPRYFLNFTCKLYKIIF